MLDSNSSHNEGDKLLNDTRNPTSEGNSNNVKLSNTQELEEEFFGKKTAADNQNNASREQTLIATVSQ